MARNIDNVDELEKDIDLVCGNVDKRRNKEARINTSLANERRKWMGF